MEEKIYNELITKFEKRQIAEIAKRNNENPFGYVIDYIKDMYGIPKTKGWDIAKKVCDHFGF